MASNHWSNFVLPVNSFPLLYLSHTRVFPICQYSFKLQSWFPLRNNVPQNIVFYKYDFCKYHHCLPYSTFMINTNNHGKTVYKKGNYRSSDNDSNGNENIKKAISQFLNEHNNSAWIHRTFCYISLPSLHECNVKISHKQTHLNENFSFCYRTSLKEQKFTFSVMFSLPSLLYFLILSCDIAPNSFNFCICCSHS